MQVLRRVELNSKGVETHLEKEISFENIFIGDGIDTMFCHLVSLS